MLKQIFDNLDKQCGKHSHYFDVYEKHFERFIGKKPVVVEVGICYGGSAEMWQKYFGEGATIIGIDVDPNSFTPACQTEGCIQVRGDQSDPAFWEEFLKQYPEIDIFIDDGGHHQFQQIQTLNSVWNNINLGGVYLCEDTHTSYWAEYSGGLRRPNTFTEYSKQIIDTLNVQWWKDMDRRPDNMLFADHFKNLSGMHFYDSIVVLDKDTRTESKLLTSLPI